MTAELPFGESESFPKLASPNFVKTPVGDP